MGSCPTDRSRCVSYGRAGAGHREICIPRRPQTVTGEGLLATAGFAEVVHEGRDRADGFRHPVDRLGPVAELVAAARLRVLGRRGIRAGVALRAQVAERGATRPPALSPPGGTKLTRNRRQSAQFLKQLPNDTVGIGILRCICSNATGREEAEHVREAKHLRNFIRRMIRTYPVMVNPTLNL